MKTLIAVLAIALTACASPTEPTRVQASDAPARAIPGIGDGNLPRVPAEPPVDSSFSSIPTPVTKTPPVDTGWLGTQPVGPRRQP